jgi:hypothetical protein
VGVGVDVSVGILVGVSVEATVGVSLGVDVGAWVPVGKAAISVPLLGGRSLDPGVHAGVKTEPNATAITPAINAILLSLILPLRLGRKSIPEFLG